MYTKLTSLLVLLSAGSCSTLAWGQAPAMAQPSSTKTVWLDDLNLGVATQGFGSPQKNKSVEGRPLTLGGRKFERGFGTHAASRLLVNLKGGALRFSATVGVDNEINDPAASVEFKVCGDNRMLWESGVMKAGQAPKTLANRKARSRHPHSILTVRCRSLPSARPGPTPGSCQPPATFRRVVCA